LRFELNMETGERPRLERLDLRIVGSQFELAGAQADASLFTIPFTGDFVILRGVSQLQRNWIFPVKPHASGSVRSATRSEQLRYLSSQPNPSRIHDCSGNERLTYMCVQMTIR
jgi:hypothetical protein